MTHLNIMAVLFKSLMGEVGSGDVARSFQLMGKGMLGIFIVMLLIFAVIVVLNKSTGTHKDTK